MSSDCRIRVLPDLLVKKIAAGEVVERPSSVVKELLENAVDAGAARIALAIEDGGRQLIRVTDDGGGMSPEELRLAVTPHATSKILVEDDLYAIATMGFRGEALASISSVAKLRIVSRRAESIEGYEIRVVGETIESSGSAGCPVGTTVEVRDLFFNVPARRKFLRGNATEVGHVNEQLARIALAHPEIGFELSNNGRVTQSLPACATRVERVAKFYGPQLAAALMHVQRDERGVRLEAFAAPPAQSRATAQWQYAFVNGRHVRDRFIQHALKEAYRGLTEPNRHGVVFLFLTVDPRDVDVNVHPTKIEVRWADPNLIHSQVLSALRETFQRNNLAPVLRTGRPGPPIDPEAQDRIRREMADLLKSTPPIRPPAGGASAVGAPDRTSSDWTSYARSTDASDPLSSWRALYARPERAAGSIEGEPEAAPSATPSEQRTPEPTAGGDRWTAMERGPGAMYAPGRSRAVQMHNLYLVAETEDGIVIVDQHALHERVLYEQFKQRLTGGAFESQRLLLPETLNVTARQQALLDENAELLQQIGLEITAYGSDAIAVHGFPSLLKDTDVASFVRDLLDRLATPTERTSPDQLINDLLSMMACKAAVKAGDPLTPEEIDALFVQRALIDKPSSCPHGRPTTLRLSKADLDRQFHRT